MTDQSHAGPPSQPQPGRPVGAKRFVVNLPEHGAPVHGEPQTLDRRLFFQLHVFTDCLEPQPAVTAVMNSGLEAVVYANVSDPRGISVLLLSEDPDVFAGAGRDVLRRPPFSTLTPMPDFTMFGRTYAAGREPNLEDFLLHKGRRNALNPESRWALWYPLRRIGAFNRLSKMEQGKIMVEHAMIGRAYGETGHALDIRLECHGLDRDDNEFVLGILGPELYPLSKLVKDMRATRQTSEFIESMGPFFVGRVLAQTPLPDAD